MGQNRIKDIFNDDFVIKMVWLLGPTILCYATLSAAVATIALLVTSIALWFWGISFNTELKEKGYTWLASAKDLSVRNRQSWVAIIMSWVLYLLALARLDSI